MPKYLIEVPHEADKVSCAKAIQVFLQSSSHYLTNCEWGCEDGEHYGWMMVDCPSKEDACMIVPPAYRTDARVVQLSRFSMDEIEETIRQHDG